MLRSSRSPRLTAVRVAASSRSRYSASSSTPKLLERRIRLEQRQGCVPRVELGADLGCQLTGRAGWVLAEPALGVVVRSPTGAQPGDAFGDPRPDEPDERERAYPGEHQHDDGDEGGVHAGVPCRAA
jgi:hypothetical protein